MTAGAWRGAGWCSMTAAQPGQPPTACLLHGPHHTEPRPAPSGQAAAPTTPGGQLLGHWLCPGEACRGAGPAQVSEGRDGGQGRAPASCQALEGVRAAPVPGGQARRPQQQQEAGRRAMLPHASPRPRHAAPRQPGTPRPQPWQPPRRHLGPAGGGQRRPGGGEGRGAGGGEAGRSSRRPPASSGRDAPRPRPTRPRAHRTPAHRHAPRPDTPRRR